MCTRVYVCTHTHPYLGIYAGLTRVIVHVDALCLDNIYIYISTYFT